MYTINVNGEMYDVEAPLDKPVLWILREELGLLGTKFGCGFGICGACTVLIDGEPKQTCVVNLEEVLEKSIITIEGLNDDVGQNLKKQWAKESVPQCGYCQPGFIMSAAALFKSGEPVDDESINGLTNICRCGTYERVKRAILNANKDSMVQEVQP